MGTRFIHTIFWIYKTEAMKKIPSGIKSNIYVVLSHQENIFDQAKEILSVPGWLRSLDFQEI